MLIGVPAVSKAYCQNHIDAYELVSRERAPGENRVYDKKQHKTMSTNAPRQPSATGTLATGTLLQASGMKEEGILQ